MPDVPGASSAPATTSTPAPAATPAPETAASKAVASGDFSSFRKARAAERAGEPLPVPTSSASSASEPADTTQAAPTGASSTPASEAGKPQKNGHGGNADTRIKELLAENKRLREQAATPKTPATQTPTRAASSAAQPVNDPKPNPQDATKYPDGQYDPKFIEDLGRWSAREERRSADTAEQTKQAETARTEASRQRNATFTERFDAAKAADPKFLDALSPEVLALRPFDALQPGEVPSARHAIAEEILSSEVGPQLLRHFSEHPEDLARLSAMTPRVLLREFARIEDKVTSAVQKPAAAPAAEVPVVSQAPPPPERLEGKQSTPADPIKSAVASGDFGAFRAAKRARMEANAR